VLAYFWVKNELAYGKHSSPNSYLVAAGAWSYSLYLVHAQGMELYWRLPIPNLGYIFGWFGAMFCSLGLAFVFYVLVERPSHRLARKVRVTKTAAMGEGELLPAVPVAGPDAPVSA